MNLAAIIPVRAGSQRVKNKNLKPFAGSTLLDIKLDLLKSLGDQLSSIIVSSDSEEMLAVAKNHGVETHKRKPYFASSACSNSEFFKNLADEINHEHIMYAPVTAPLVSRETYLEAISIYKKGIEQGALDSLVTSKVIKHHMWLNGKALNYDPTQAPNSQDLPEIQSLTYGINIIPRDIMQKRQNIVGGNPKFYNLDEIESFDIDTEFDFMLAEMVYKKVRSQT